ncbi:hypothetical protein ACLI4Q_05610 [Natrialbaceae archaeon A-CW1-1]
MLVESVTLEGIVAGILIAVVGRVIGGILIERWRRYQKSHDQVDEWFEETLGLIGRLQQAGYQSTSFQSSDYAALRQRLEPLAADLHEHALRAPDRVSKDARIELIFLAASVTSLITLSEQSEKANGFEFIELLHQRAHESYDGEQTIDDVSPILDRFDLDAMTEAMDFEDIDLDPEAADEFCAHFTTESLEAGHPTSVEEAVGMPLEKVDEAIENEEFWQEVQENMLHASTHVFLVDLTKDVLRSMEQRKKQI